MEERKKKHQPFAPPSEGDAHCKGKLGEPSLGPIQTSMQWACQSNEVKKELAADCHREWDLFFFTCNIPFHHIDNPHFRAAIQKTKKATLTLTPSPTTHLTITLTPLPTTHAPPHTPVDGQCLELGASDHGYGVASASEFRDGHLGGVQV